MRYYLGRNLLVALGVAVSTAVLTGGLIIGDSVRFSLEQTAWYRLGNVTHAVTVTDRYFRQELAGELQAESGYDVAPVLMLEGMAVAGGGQQRVNRVQVIGIDDGFARVTGMARPFEVFDNDVVISRNMADRLEVEPGDALLVRIAKASLIPKNAPFVSDTETTVTLRATVKAIVEKEEMGHFNLKNSQSAPFNLFISIDRLNRLMEFEGRANRLLIHAENAEIPDLYNALANRILPADGSLLLKYIPLTGETEISSERVFMESTVTDAFSKIPGTNKVLTYFVNSLKSEGRETPYSFVASSSGFDLKHDEVILNEWTAGDLGVSPGDTIRMAYFEIGPLRQLEERETTLRVKEIVPVEGIWADGDLMPHLPGLSDAGHCREWEAGVPIDLDKIRHKDEEYWEKYKGIPKAFISAGLGQQLWANRFGNYTAIRIPGDEFSDEDFSGIFHEHIRPADIGMALLPVREEGLAAARGGVDFSQLFLGLSFFLLLAAILLSALMFRFNLESRSSQTGTLIQLGFRNRLIFKMILLEAAVIATVGILAGLALAVLYTRVVFKFLNTLWWDIVRTEVLFIHININTLLLGGLVSMLVILAAVSLPLNRYLKRRVAELHRKGLVTQTSGNKRVKFTAAIALPLLAALLLVWQLMAGEGRNASLFFVAGGLLLPGLLLWADLWLASNRGEGKGNDRSPGSETSGDLTMTRLVQRNLSRNRSRSLTIIILFALGTFLVVSTGANRQDMFADAGKKTSGAGGFQYFAETSVPVLFDLNDPSRRATEGLPSSFHSVQFHRVEGDDASCLNLNRISNPAILGFEPGQLTGRFSFSTRTDDLDPEDPWGSLDKELPGGVVPAIADQTVIQWGLGLKVGDTLMYQNETGDTLRLKLIGGLAPSIFQGYVIIGNSHFLKHYPSHSGSSVFLVETDGDGPEETGSELQMIFRDYGWEMNQAPQRLAEFYSVTNTYLSIFLALGALGLALGTIGLALVLARTIMERHHELAVLRAVGFRKAGIVALVAGEYGRLLSAGVAIGFVTAVVATLPAFFSENTDISFSTIAWVVALILINGFIWIYGLAALMIRPAKLTDALHNE
jgi:ABC-type antimicrobial peptide transport system permease subunit